MTVAQVEIPETEITDLCRRHGIRRLALFGSVLTSRFSDSSDVDILVEFRPQAELGRRPLSAERQQHLELGLGEAGQVRPVAAEKGGAAYTIGTVA